MSLYFSQDISRNNRCKGKYKTTVIPDKFTIHCKKCINDSYKKRIKDDEYRSRQNKQVSTRGSSPANYDTYATKLQYAEWVQKDENGKLQVKCAKCEKVMYPNVYAVKARISSLHGKRRGDSNFYCSQECKDECPTYQRHKYPKGYKDTDERHDVPDWLKREVKERDNYTCQQCGANDVDMEIHHILPYTQNPALAHDKDNLVTLCEDCHKEIHHQEGMQYHQLSCNLPHDINAFNPIENWGRKEYNNYTRSLQQNGTRL